MVWPTTSLVWSYLPPNLGSGRVWSLQPCELAHFAVGSSVPFPFPLVAGTWASAAFLGACGSVGAFFGVFGAFGGFLRPFGRLGGGFWPL